MATVRPIRRMSQAKPTVEGAGVHLRRAFGFGSTQDTDPFLLLDDFRSDVPAEYRAGFPWHPHRGIETITYMIEGEVEHGDSLGHTGVIGAGDVQWMTAGSGIVHQEMPRATASRVNHGLQLWANLPRTHKMMDPRYRDVARDAIPEVEVPGGGRVKVVAGRVGGVDGPVQDIVIDPLYLDVTLPASASFRHPVPTGFTVFAYVVDGQGAFDATPRPPIGANHLVVYGDGDEVQATAGDGPLRFLLVSGRPLNEPVAWYGPIVMNTQQELDVAFDEYRRGTFLKHGKKE
jgi:redox-sensitive bicupin YhaK (pirin superfamily)